MNAKKKLSSIAELAALVGVSKSTVSRALGGSSLVNEETKARILTVAREYDFQLNLPARYLSLGASRTIAFVTQACCDSGDKPDLFGLEIMGGVAAGLDELGYDMLALYVAPDDDDWIARYYDSGVVAGFILMTYENKPRQLELLAEREAPFITRGLGEGKYCSVNGDNRRGGALAAERFLSRGRRLPAFIGGPADDPEVTERFAGYRGALEAAGLELAQARVAHGDFSEESGAAAMAALLEAAPELDAVFAASDLMAIAAMRHLAARGRRVPQDVAVIGYDDLRLASYVSPALTTVSQSVTLTGKLLARDLVAYLQSGQVTNRVVPVELIARDSA